MTAHGLTVEDRFWLYAIPSPGGGCWEWDGGKSKGRPRMYVGIVNGKKKHEYAYRVAWKLYFGPIPDGVEIDHTCENIGCVNPWHLQPVSGYWNRSLQGLRQEACVHGHLYDDDNTYIDPQGHRRCRACARERRLAA